MSHKAIASDTHNKQIEFIKASVCYRDYESKDSPFYFYNEALNDIRKINAPKSEIKDVYNDKDIDKVVDSKMFAKIVTRPYTMKRCFVVNETICLNEYKHPQSIFQDAKLKTNTAIPFDYMRFFEHLFVDPASIEFVLDWMACSLRGKIQNFLLLIGNEGIGKGLLCDILTSLNLQENTTLIDNETFQGRFNGELKGKTLIIADEIKIKDDMAANKLKLYVNKTMPIEGKGKQKETIETPFNVIISSNNDDAVRINETSRRYSIPFLTEVALVKQAWFSHDYYKTITEDKVLLESLYWALWNRKVTRDMNVAFKDQGRTDDIMNSTMSEWENIAVTTIRKANGKPVDWNTIRSKMIGEVHMVPGINKFYFTIKERYKNTIECHRVKNDVTCRSI